MSTEDMAAPQMDNRKQNKKKDHKNDRLWRPLPTADEKDGRRRVICWNSILVLFPAIVSLSLGLPVLIVGVWALVQGTSYLSFAAMLLTHDGSVRIITALAPLLVLLFIMGVVILLGGIVHILYFRLSGERQEAYARHKRVFLIFFVFVSLVITLLAVHLAVGFIYSLPEITQLSAANTTFNNYLSDQSVQENFDNVQHNLKCCGVEAFTDYESIFNNLSVPVSCCNTADPLANETTCPEIVSDGQQANETGLIYSEGCVPQLQSMLEVILAIVLVSPYYVVVLSCILALPSCMLCCLIILNNKVLSSEPAPEPASEPAKMVLQIVT